MRVMKKRKTYALSFREDAIALVHRSDRPIAEIGESLGVPKSTLRYWYEADMKKKGKGRPAAKLPVGDPAGESPEEKVARLERQVAALEKENEALKLDRAILKKAAAFFAKESE
jgi:transposase